MQHIILSVLLLISWLAVYTTEKRTIFIQWLQPGKRRTYEFSAGLFFAGALCVATQIALSKVSNLSWTVSSEAAPGKIMLSLLYDLNSVLIEELLFRGVILYFLIKYFNATKGVVISAAGFGIYHWFTFGVIGNVLAMIVVFATTGLMGFVFGTAYAKTNSIALPVGIHLGWNWINNTVYSRGPNGIQWLQPTAPTPLTGVYGTISLILYLLIPFLFLYFVKSNLFRKTEAISRVP